jgi:hypothetical protein
MHCSIGTRTTADGRIKRVVTVAVTDWDDQLDPSSKCASADDAVDSSGR